MGHTTSFSLRIIGAELPPRMLLDALLQCRWSANDHGMIRVGGLPRTVSEDEYWFTAPWSDGWRDEVYTMVSRVESEGRTVGVVLVHESGVGGVFWIYAGGRVDFSPWVDRVCIGDTRWTDVSHYIALFQKSFACAGFRLSGMEWSEIE